MKLLPYLISSLVFVAGIYFTYTFYSSFNQTNTDENIKTLSSIIVNKKDVYEHKKDNETIAINSIEKNNSSNEKIIIPTVDILKVGPDGSYIIAGKGKPNSTISLLEKGNEIESVDADKSGNWVIVSQDNLESGDNLLIINQENIDGTSTQSKEIYVTKIDKENERIYQMGVLEERIQTLVNLLGDGDESDDKRLEEEIRESEEELKKL